MEEEYWETMKSGIADMVNTGGRAAGSITASLFLKQVCYSSKRIAMKCVYWVFECKNCTFSLTCYFVLMFLSTLYLYVAR